MKFLAISALSFLPGLLAPLGEAPAPEPVVAEPAALVTTEKDEVSEVVKTAVNKVVAILRDDSLTRVQKRETSMKIVEPLIDFQTLSMLSLGKTHWSRATPEQRDTFSELFAETLKLSYFEKLELFSDEKVEFEEPVAKKTKGSPKYTMVSYIISKGERIRVGYDLWKKDGQWMVYDFEIEGVSIKKSYGSQYGDYLREHSFDELLATMRDKIQEAKRKDVEQA